MQTIGVIGAGQMGSGIAQTIAQHGLKVLLTDRELAIAEESRAGIERADAVVTATNGDNTNIMVAQIAQKMYRVKRVVARCNDPVRSSAYELLGLNTICPTT